MVDSSKSTGKLILLLTCSVCILTLALFGFLYKCDNKYTAGPPYGENGSLSFHQSQLSQPIFLIDGWEIYPDSLYSPSDFSTAAPAQPETVFIGQYSNFSMINDSGSPFGTATYRLQLSYDGTPCTLALEIPEIFTSYTLWIDDQLVSSDKDHTRLVSFFMDGNATLTLNVENSSHYYSGLTYPPMLGTPDALHKVLFVRTVFYMFLCTVAVTLSLFSLVIWCRRERDGLFLHFGMLCLFFTLHCIHPFVWQMGLSGSLWYALEDASWIALLAEAGYISAWATDPRPSQGLYARMYQATLLAAFAAFAFVVFIIPASPVFVNVYGTLMDVMKVLFWAYFAVCTGFSLLGRNLKSLFILSGCCVLGTSLFSNMMDNNKFEPIYTGWQTEYAGFILVLLFGGLIIQRNAEIIRENRLLTAHLEEQVQLRTKELKDVLLERKNFFSDMAHNLKAPVSAIHGFIDLIQERNLYVDEELKGYIQLIQEENQEMRKRIQALQTLNAFDRIEEASCCISVSELLFRIQEQNEPEATAYAIHLSVRQPEKDCWIYGQWEKVLMVFENLIYNAISFTPPEGSISISAQLREDKIFIEVADTGCGILPEHLPHIFQRFYSVRSANEDGSGLGLYIASITIEAMNGSNHLPPLQVVVCDSPIRAKYLRA